MANTKVTTGVIKDDAVGADQLAPNAVVTASMVDNAVTTAKIANDAILTAKISDNAVNNAKLSSNSVDSDQYVDGSIDTAHIADSQITSAKLDTNIAVGGTLTVGSHLNMGDNDILKMGADADLKIYHDGSHSIVADTGTGDLLLKGNASVKLQGINDSNLIIANQGGAVTLYYSNAAKLETVSGGVTVTGVLTATSLDISGDIDVDGTTNLDVVDIDGAVDMASSLILSTNSTAISMKDASGAATRMFILNSANSTYLGPVDSYAGGEILYGTSSNVTGHRMYVGAADRFNVTGSSVVVNEAGADADFRVESDAISSAFVLEGSSGNIGIGSYPLNAKVDIEKESDYSSHTGHGLAIHSSATNAYTSLYVGTDDTIDCAYIQTAGRNTSFTTKKLLLNPNGGSVGIGTGTNTPKGVLDVQGAVYSNLTLSSAHGYSQNRNWDFISNSFGAGSWGGLSLRQSTGTGGTPSVSRFGIDINGKVGFGQTSPAARVHITDAADKSEGDSHLRIEGSGYSGFHWLNGTAYYIGQNSNGRQLRMYSGSNEAVGVYLTNGGNSWSSYSDERLKENITDIGSVTEKIKDIRCVTYNRKDVDDENKHETIGFIAQDFVGKFDQVLDESKVSDTDEETRYSIRYTETIPILLKAIQEQQTLIESLTARIETLEG